MGRPDTVDAGVRAARPITQSDVPGAIDVYRSHILSLLRPIWWAALSTPSTLWLRGLAVPPFIFFSVYMHVTDNPVLPWVCGAIAALIVPLLVGGFVLLQLHLIARKGTDKDLSEDKLLGYFSDQGWGKGSRFFVVTEGDLAKRAAKQAAAAAAAAAGSKEGAPEGEGDNAGAEGEEQPLLGGGEGRGGSGQVLGCLGLANRAGGQGELLYFAVRPGLANAEVVQDALLTAAVARAAVLLLAGGQGTRLGSAAPKGCYDIGLPSHKSLFQLQAERLLRTQQLAAAATGTAAVDVKPLRWYIMTSAFTHEETVAHFEQHNYFGLKQEQVIFFQQGFLPCFTEDGKLILEAPGRLAKAPDGNGGVYLALARSGLLEEMAVAGVEALDCYCVDNALARLGDPRFIGYCHGGAGGGAGADVGARVVAKAYPEEKVGVFARRAGAAAASGPASALCVLEYSELDPARAAATDPATGHLYFNWSNICMHYFSVPWLRRVASELLAGGGSAYHVARKRIPSVSGPVPGVKLELFIFDTFPLAGERTALVEVDRREEFAPVKNAPGSASDSPDTARAALLSLHVGWVKAAGGAVACAEGVEVSPLLSYGGEGLGQVVGGKSYDTPWADELQRPAA